jgi:hypothetical protein|tara:strand:+ start:3611 stop:4249 length:639 start_codon:yes stop_codon:yes gene_type:complete
MLSRIGVVENIPVFLKGVKEKKEKMFGFGHRVYRNFDPRAGVIQKIAEEVFSLVGKDPLIDVAVALESAARNDSYFVERKLYPNVDFYSGLVYRALGFPPEFFTVLFAVPRATGYLAHWRESLSDPDVKIMRPQQVYQVRPDFTAFPNPGTRRLPPLGDVHCHPKEVHYWFLLLACSRLLPIHHKRTVEARLRPTVRPESRRLFTHTRHGPD